MPLVLIVYLATSLQDPERNVVSADGPDVGPGFEPQTAAAPVASSPLSVPRKAQDGQGCNIASQRCSHAG